MNNINVDNLRVNKDELEMTNIKKEDFKDILPKADEFTSEYFLNVCEGRCKNGEARSTIGISLLLYTGSTEKNELEQMSNDLNYKEIATRVSKRGEIRFIQNKENVIVDIVFKTHFEPEFQLFWKQFEDYEKCLRDMKNPIKGVPFLNINVVPDTYADECYLAFVNPTFWTLQPASSDSDDCCVIRMLVPADNFYIQDVPQEVDLTKYEADAARVYNTILLEN